MRTCVEVCVRTCWCLFAHVCACVYVLVAFLTCLLVYSDSGDDIELASCPHGQASKDCSMVASCSCELLSEGEQKTRSLLYNIQIFSDEFVQI